MTHTGILIRTYRDSHELTQIALAKSLKIHTQQLWAIEKGIGPCPLPIARKLTRILGIQRHEFRFAMSRDWFEKFDKKWSEK